MNYKNKYLKYKNKYVTLKKQIGGNKEYFELITIESGTILYHGSFNQVKGNINVPGYLSTDPLQSLGHIISTASKLDNSKQDELGNLKKISLVDLNKISSCYPIIYKYNTVKELKLLKMNVGTKLYNETFGVLFNKELIKSFLDELEPIKKIEVLTNFRKKLEGLGIRLIPEEEIPITNDNFFWMYCVLFDKYNKICKSACFGGWSNTPGYYLLSNIDYNEYFKNILEEIVPYVTLDGIYVERDQNEIVLFNNLNLSNEPETNFILPFYINKPEDAVNFIIKYDIAIKEYLQDKYNVNKQNTVINLFKKLNHIDEVGTEKWDFDWFKTYCENYNPYEKIDKTNCTHPEFINPKKEKEQCLKRFPLNPKNIGLEDDVGDEAEQLRCDNFLSSKISILNIENESKKSLLKEWIYNNVINSKFSENNLNLFKDNKICQDRNSIVDRILTSTSL